MIRIHVDPQKCVGAGHCVRNVPEVFDQREDDGTVVLLRAQAPDELAPFLHKAAHLCPAQVIRISEDE